MTLQIELEPELEALLVAEAREDGVGVEEHAHKLLSNAVASRPQPKVAASGESFWDTVDALRAKVSPAPHLQDIAFDREMIYGDQD